MRLPHLGHDTRGTEATCAWTEGTPAAVPMLHRPPEGIRLCRPLTLKQVRTCSGMLPLRIIAVIREFG